MKDHQ